MSVGVSQYHLGLIEDASRLFDLVLSTDESNAEALIFKAMCLAERGNYKAADGIYLDLLNVEPESFRIQRLYALSAEKQDLADLAEARWLVVLSSYPDSAEALLKTGIWQFKGQKYREALSCFDALLKGNPLHDAAVYFKTRCLVELDENELAEQLLSKSVDGINGASPAIHTVYANLAEEKKEWSVAIERWDNAVERFPDDIGLLQKAGLCYAKAGQQARAISYLTGCSSLSQVIKLHSTRNSKACWS